jgi:hypothetical protein
MSGGDLKIRIRVDAGAALRSLAQLTRALELIAATRRALPEIATATAFITGWLLITKGVADLTRPAVWPISIGLLFMSLCGWRLIRTVFTAGLYALSQRAKDEPK